MIIARDSLTEQNRYKGGGQEAAYTGRFFRKGTSEGRGVILSAAKDLSPSTTIKLLAITRAICHPERSEGSLAGYNADPSLRSG